MQVAGVVDASRSVMAEVAVEPLRTMTSATVGPAADVDLVGPGVSGRRPGRRGMRSCLGGRRPVSSSSTSPLRAPGGGVDGDRRPAAGRLADGRDGPGRSGPRRVAGLVVAVEDGVDHLVDRAGADRVVGAVADHLAARRRRGRAAASASAGGNRAPERLGQPLEADLGPGARPGARRPGWRSTPISRLAAGARAQLAGPRRQGSRPPGRGDGRRRAATWSASEHDLEVRSRPGGRWPRPRAGPARAWGMRWSVPFIQSTGSPARAPVLVGTSPRSGRAAPWRRRGGRAPLL